MRGCLDEGLLQSYFDGELSRKQMESVTLHLAACPGCAAAARQLESELGLVASALAPELEAVVPTERLRQRIDAAVAGLPQVDQPAILKPGGLRWLSSLFAFRPQQALGYAALAVVVAFGVVFAIVQKQQTSPTASVPDTRNSNSMGVAKNEAGTPETPETPPKVVVTVADDSSRRKVPVKTIRSTANPRVAQVKLIPGERSYLKTIAALDSTIKANNDRPMRPTLRAEYERNLAVVNRALAATRNAAKKNPNDPDAKEFLFDAYQSKVDLLNTVADARTFNRQQ